MVDHPPAFSFVAGLDFIQPDGLSKAKPIGGAASPFMGFVSLNPSHKQLQWRTRFRLKPDTKRRQVNRRI
jgi:hypothetical protein